MESNGSTSQGSICASSLSLMAAGVPIKAPVAGISVGLVTGEGDDDYIILTDIQGLEDFFGANSPTWSLAAGITGFITS